MIFEKFCLLTFSGSRVGFEPEDNYIEYWVNIILIKKGLKSRVFQYNKGYTIYQYDYLL